MTEKSDFLPPATRRNPPRQIVFVAFDGAEPLDLAGPIGVFSRAEELVPGSYDIRVASSDGIPIKTRSPLTLGGIEPLSGIKGTIDTLLVAGGSEQAIRRAALDPALVAWVGAHAGAARRVGSICTGAFVLGAAGLLDGRAVTTHWAAVAALKEYFPRAQVEADAIYRIDGPICTSAGVTAGIDLALALVKADLGHAVAAAIARDLVLYLHRPGGQRQFSSTLEAQAAGSGLFSELLAWMQEHPRADLSVPALADRAAMSPRNFARRFTQEVGTTPARHVLQIRLDHACRHLEKTAWTIDRVAERSGWKTADTMHRVFRQELGLTPSEYRSRFAAAENVG
ncbi:GlxA family transcriptional regulator [Herbaspirillum sp.]|uniref:GlxA family transcriptional regulator n=1 Tax=Herbaspirillum sp. TaxID=1890675 RepID=UPI001B1B105E|nr:GlxA family transcriptional regulator [Herbaspirillum sp.]MBO9536324.1 GlxA family transcriptional regulator [Herbaspirillum sp.]